MLKRGKVFGYIDRKGNLYIDNFGKVEIGKSYYKEWEESETERGFACADGGFTIYDFNHTFVVGDSPNDIRLVGYSKKGFGFNFTRDFIYNDMMFCEIIVRIPDNSNVFIDFQDQNTSDKIVIESYNQIETDWNRANIRCNRQHINDQNKKLKEYNQLLEDLQKTNKNEDGKYTEIFLFRLYKYFGGENNKYLEALDIYSKEISKNFQEELKNKINDIKKDLEKYPKKI